LLYLTPFLFVTPASEAVKKSRDGFDVVRASRSLASEVPKFCPAGETPAPHFFTASLAGIFFSCFQ